MLITFSSFEADKIGSCKYWFCVLYHRNSNEYTCSVIVQLMIEKDTNLVYEVVLDVRFRYELANREFWIMIKADLFHLPLPPATHAAPAGGRVAPSPPSSHRRWYAPPRKALIVLTT
jgi:hypothetical protein